MGEETEILYIGFLLGHGGDAHQMLGLAAGMAARGRRVKIVVPELPTTVEFAGRCEAQGIPAVRSPLLHSDPHAARQSIPELLELLTRYRAPIVHFHTGDECLPRMALLVRRVLDSPRAFVTVHSPYAAIDPQSGRAKMWAVGVERQFHALFCPSEHARQTQLRYGVPADRIHVIHNGIDVDRFANGNAASARAVLGLKAETPLLVFTSRLDPQKRPLDALRAFAGVAAEFPEAHLAFVGTGEQESAVRVAATEAGLMERVHLVGFRSDIPDWLAAATVWMLPTERENFSLAVLEALAAGCPILSNHCPGNDEVLRNGENALLTAVGDVPAQSEVLRRLLRDTDLRQRLRLSARQSAEAYRLETMTAQYAAVYNEYVPLPVSD